MITDALIAALPKTDLHVHLDGSLRIETVIELAREHGIELPSNTPEGLRELVFKPNYSSLVEYLAGFAYTTAVMQTAEALERTAYELAWDNINEGVRYIEVRFAPHLHMHRALGFDAVMQAVTDGLRRASDEFEASAAVAQRGEPPFRFGLIVCALRMFEANSSALAMPRAKRSSGSPHFSSPVLRSVAGMKSVCPSSPSTSLAKRMGTRRGTIGPPMSTLT
jgi:adenosine deaminase